MQPYIGITGFMSRSEVEKMLKVMLRDGRHKLMVGVLASSKSFRGIPNKWPGRYPEVKEIANIFIDHPLSLNLIHFNFKESLGGRLHTELCALMEVGGLPCHGFQLNIPWPNIAELEMFRMSYPDAVIVLQIGATAIKRANDPKVMAALIRRYSSLINYVLLDPSGGFGQPLDDRKLFHYLDEIYQPNLGIGYGVAGGLSAKTMHLIHRIARAYPDICIDAEGKLRDDQDQLHLPEGEAYLLEGVRVLG